MYSSPSRKTREPCESEAVIVFETGPRSFGDRTSLPLQLLSQKHLASGRSNFCATYSGWRRLMQTPCRPDLRILEYTWKPLRGYPSINSEILRELFVVVMAASFCA